MTSHANVFSRLWATAYPVEARKTENPLRIGILGAANIAPPAVINPAKSLSDVIIIAVAARDKARAQEFATKHGIPTVLDGYEELITSEVVDAVYIALPNGLHFEWTKRALEAGKHVLLEKPAVSNSTQAASLIAISAKYPNLILLEAFHYRFHPACLHFHELVRSSTYGSVNHAFARLNLPPIFPTSDIRFNWSLAGGATMDAGCYTINAVRWIMGAEPTNATDVNINKLPNVHNQIDFETRAEFEFPPSADETDTPRTAVVEHSLGSSYFGSKSIIPLLRAETATHTLSMWVFIAPWFFHSIRVTEKATGKVVSVEKVYGALGWSTYTYQLDAFVKAIRTGEKAPGWVTDEDVMGNMRAIDLVYAKAGLLPRE